MQVVAMPAMLNEQCTDVTISITLDVRQEVTITCSEMESFYLVELEQLYMYIADTE